MKTSLRTFAKMVYSLSCIPIRLYKDKKVVLSYPQNSFSPDPCTPYLQELLDQPDFVNLYSTKELLFYGTVKQSVYTLVFGPVGKIRMGDAELTRELFLLGEPRERLKELRSYFNDIPSDIEIVRFAEILCDVNFYLNGINISPYEISIFSSFSDNAVPLQAYAELQKNLSRIRDANYEGDDEYNSNNIRRAYAFEQNMLHYISHGETEKLKELLGDSGSHAVTTGKLAHDNLRQLKNEMICLAVLASRAAIDGGLDIELSYSLCNIYLQRIEKSYLFNELFEISGQIFFDYTSRVNKLQTGNDNSPIVDRAIRYITANINQKIHVDDLAAYLKVNRSYLSTKFKKDTGISVSDYITQQKIIEAQRLLKYTDRSLAQISNYLDFSSQSYFQLQFKKYTGMTPAQYKRGGNAR